MSDSFPQIFLSVRIYMYEIPYIYRTFKSERPNFALKLVRTKIYRN